MGLHEMETKTQSETNNGDEDYIDMEVSSSSSSPSSSSSSTSSFISFAVSSPPHSLEFEFQMCSSSAASGELTTTPADDLFYKGKLLPLHLPPRLQMVQKLLETSATPSDADEPSTTADNTPLESRAFSPCESRRLSSSEIVNPDEHFFQLSSELKNLIENDNPRSRWNKKIKQIRQSSLTLKLKASRAYIMALFTKPGCSDSEIDPKSKYEDTKYSKSQTKKNPFGRIEYFDEFQINRSRNNNSDIHRRSFSGVIQRHCRTKCLSSSGSNSSGSSSSSSSSSFSFGSSDLQFLNRSSSASSEIDNSIQGAIAHCKQSFSPRKSNVSEGELCSSRTSVSGERERTEISRI